MDVCLMVEGQEGVSWEQWRALARAAEDAGLGALFRSDHYRSIVRGEPAGSLDAWATLAALATCTERIRLGTMVSPVTFRHPAVLAKNAVTVDHVSHGRVELGIGAGWYEAAGVERAMLQHLVHEDVEMVALLGEVAAQVAD
jgi:alkanesulfonate monooxygenase SsuD/methylene tetrahydromethanopterin reductase-like flavin-dependent oxidoreductase (luciferase family)